MSASKRDRLGAELSAYLDGELDEARAVQVERLLKRSQPARRQLAELRTAREQLRRLPRRKAPAELAETVRRRLERQALLESSRQGRLRRVLPWLAPMAAAAGVLLAVGLWQRARPARNVAAGPVATQREVPAREPATHTNPDVAPAPLARAAAAARPREPEAPETPAAVTPAAGARVAAGGARSSPEATAAKHDETTQSRSFAYTSAADVLMGPQLELVLRPDDARQYARAVRVLDQWQTAPAGGAAGEGNGGSLSSPVARSPAASGRLSWAARLTVMQTRRLLDQLGRTCPDAVEVTLRFTPRDMTLVQALVGARRPEGQGLVWALPASPGPERKRDGHTSWSAPYYATRAYARSSDDWAVPDSSALEKPRPAAQAGGRLLMVSMDELAQRWMDRGPDYAREAVEFIGQTARTLLSELWTSASVVDVQVRISPPPASQPDAPAEPDPRADSRSDETLPK